MGKDNIQIGDWVKPKDSWELIMVGEKTSLGITPKGRDDVVFLYNDIEKVSNKSKTSSFKKLIAKVSYDQLQDICDKKGWRIPTFEEIKDFDYGYRTIWVSDEPERDPNTHRSVLDNGNMKISNRGFLYNAVVIREGDAIINALNRYVEELED